MASCATPARPLALLTLLSALAGCATASGTASPVAAAGSPEARTAQYFASLTPDSAERLTFLKAMPKGGDLHNHLVGAIYAESWLRWAAEDGLCADLASPRIVNPPCDATHGK